MTETALFVCLFALFCTFGPYHITIIQQIWLPIWGVVVNHHNMLEHPLILAVDVSKVICAMHNTTIINWKIFWLVVMYPTWATDANIALLWWNWLLLEEEQLRHDRLIAICLACRARRVQGTNFTISEMNNDKWTRFDVVDPQNGLQPIIYFLLSVHPSQSRSEPNRASALMGPVNLQLQKYTINISLIHPSTFFSREFLAHTHNTIAMQRRFEPETYDPICVYPSTTWNWWIYFGVFFLIKQLAKVVLGYYWWW